MNCAWMELLSVLPIWLRVDVDNLGRDTLQEIRLRAAQPVELVLGGQRMRLSRLVTQEDLQFVLNTASNYSPWSSQTLSEGYLTAPGGHRIGVCGEAVVKNGEMVGIRCPSSLCVRVARNIKGLATVDTALRGSVLIIGKPGSGKTTLLRDWIRARARGGQGSVTVVDERKELFPSGTDWSEFGVDILSGCEKCVGMEKVLRTMGPHTIAVDEITSARDCAAMLHVAWCGVKLLATAHASCREDLMARPVYKPLVEGGIFDSLVMIQDNRSWITERMPR